MRIYSWDRPYETVLRSLGGTLMVQLPIVVSGQSIGTVRRLA